ncbi:MAG: 16S rRNA (cytosine(1402)-N(4))-methyltransferase RsmH [Oscillospiraceae bacterium]|nr:16S rRNA (cytosine(1402)-N(4))-methyltransferase RsmH [Oscillospiraceae bacterium]
MNAKHVSVLLNECIDNLNTDPAGTYVDGTLGMGGHSEKIAEKLTTGRLICIDRDASAIDYARERLKLFSDRITFVHANFADTVEVLDELGIEGVNGMLFDLGVSSPQLDETERGFSYMKDAPLDMRMDRSEGLTAYDIVNTWSEDRLNRILWDYGEEKYARRISRAIINKREKKPIESTLELSDIIKSAMPSQALREKQHPAKRSFQAIRIAVNDELGAVAKMAETVPDKLLPGGRLCIISFHSLEDRIVKSAIAARENGCTCPREAPICTCGFVKTLKSVYRKPILPSEEEIENNPRARSAKLRVAERV